MAGYLADAPIKALKAVTANQFVAAKTHHQTGCRLQEIRSENSEAVLRKVAVEGEDPGNV